MAGFVNLFNEWTIRAVVLVSLGAHVALVLLARVRRRESSSWRMFLLWLAYQVSDWAAPYTLSHLSALGSTPRGPQQLVVLWVAFLLMHLGGPDNIAAYSLEDNKLSVRQLVKLILQIVGSFFVIYKQVHIGGDGTLLWASFVMVVVGVVKYVEKFCALANGDFGKMSSASERKKLISLDGRGLSNEEALKIAHDLLHVTKGAFADYLDHDADRLWPVFPWEDMRKVVEMELSLMYDTLYTKAAVAHTWFGYLIRVASPTATATVTLLFWFHSNEGQKRVDVLVTYILLVTMLLLDVAWLLRATVSTWTYAFLSARPACWLHHALLCSGRWHRLRRVLIAPLVRISREEIGSYRLWSGFVGQYNLLDECTPATSLFSWLLEGVGWLLKKLKVASEEALMEYKYSRGIERDVSQNVKELLFGRIRKTLELVYHPTEKSELKPNVELKRPLPAFPPPPKIAVLDIREIEMREEASKTRRLLEKALGFLPAFQELILIWHVATDVFLLCNEQQLKNGETVKAIKALSNYLVFLVAARPDMLPDLKVRKKLAVARSVLGNKWQKKHGSSSSSSRSRCSGTRDVELARILQTLEQTRINLKREHKSDLDNLKGENSILSDGAMFAEVLRKRLNNSNWDNNRLKRTLRTESCT